jgi:hypothetical protein
VLLEGVSFVSPVPDLPEQPANEVTTITPTNAVANSF